MSCAAVLLDYSTPVPPPKPLICALCAFSAQIRLGRLPPLPLRLPPPLHSTEQGQELTAARSSGSCGWGAWTAQMTPVS